MKMVDRLDCLATGAAVIDIGSCATWGCIPAAKGNVTDATGTMDYLGCDYRSVLELPAVNVPGCGPIGDNFIETVAHLLYYVEGLGPLPELDELGRPEWPVAETVHRNCNGGSYYEEGNFAEAYGNENCRLEASGCWGPVVKCNMPSRRNGSGVGGCMNVGGKCIGCTMPGFPGKFTPYFTEQLTPYFTEQPGSNLSSAGSRILGAIKRPLGGKTMSTLDRETRWGPRGIEERLYDWVRERDANYGGERDLERRPAPERAGGN